MANVVKPLAAYHQGYHDGVEHGFGLDWLNASKRWIRAYRAGLEAGLAARRGLGGYVMEDELNKP